MNTSEAHTECRARHEVTKEIFLEAIRGKTSDAAYMGSAEQTVQFCMEIAVRGELALFKRSEEVFQQIFTESGEDISAWVEGGEQSCIR